ncbi:hypothetical protein RQP46_005795 [Phenoliferia psychrophenolica]
MPRASFSSLPAELKANVLEHVARQEKRWKARVGFMSSQQAQEEKAAHVDALRAASLVSKEWCALAAPFIFHKLHFKAAHLPLFRFSLLHKHGHRFVEADLHWDDDADKDDDATKETTSALEYTLSILPLLPNLRALTLNDDAAYRLWGFALDIDAGRDDEKGMRSVALGLVAQRVDALTLITFRPVENDEGIVDSLDPIAHCIAPMSSLTDLRIDCVVQRPLLVTGLSQDALAALRSDPPPLQNLTFECLELYQPELDFISAFTSSLTTLTLRYHNFDDLAVTTPAPLNLPFLRSLIVIVGNSEDQPLLPSLSKTLPAFFSSPVTSLEINDASGNIDFGTDSPITLLARNFPNLRHLDLHPVYAPEVSLVAAFCAGRGLPPPSKTPFGGPAFTSGITDKESDVLCDGLEGVLDWGKLEVGRLRAGGRVADSVGLLESLRPLDAHRRRWMD